MNSIKNTQSLENKGSFNAKKAQKKPKLADNRAQIRLSEKSKDDWNQTWQSYIKTALSAQYNRRISYVFDIAPWKLSQEYATH